MPISSSNARLTSRGSRKKQGKKKVTFLLDPDNSFRNAPPTRQRRRYHVETDPPVTAPISSRLRTSAGAEDRGPDFVPAPRPTPRPATVRPSRDRLQRDTELAVIAIVPNTVKLPLPQIDIGTTEALADDISAYILPHLDGVQELYDAGVYEPENYGMFKTDVAEVESMYEQYLQSIQPRLKFDKTRSWEQYVDASQVSGDTSGIDTLVMGFTLAEPSKRPSKTRPPVEEDETDVDETTEDDMTDEEDETPPSSPVEPGSPDGPVTPPVKPVEPAVVNPPVEPPVVKPPVKPPVVEPPKTPVRPPARPRPVVPTVIEPPKPPVRPPSKPPVRPSVPTEPSRRATGRNRSSKRRKRGTGPDFHDLRSRMIPKNL